MKLYQERVVKEKEELDKRLAKLVAFGTTERFAGLPVPEKLRMSRQRILMKDYSKVLGERIEAFVT